MAIHCKWIRLGQLSTTETYSSNKRNCIFSCIFYLVPDWYWNGLKLANLSVPPLSSVSSVELLVVDGDTARQPCNATCLVKTKTNNMTIKTTTTTTLTCISPRIICSHSFFRASLVGSMGWYVPASSLIVSDWRRLNKIFLNFFLHIIIFWNLPTFTGTWPNWGAARQVFNKWMFLFIFSLYSREVSKLGFSSATHTGTPNTGRKVKKCP